MTISSYRPDAAQFFGPNDSYVDLINDLVNRINISSPQDGLWNFKPANTRSIRKGLANVRSGAARMKIACVGDSTTTGQGANTGTSGLVGAFQLSYPSFLAAALTDAGIPASNQSMWGQGGASVAGYDDRRTLNSGWSNANGSLGGNMFTNSSNTNALSFLPTVDVDTFDVYYLHQSGNSDFTLDINGGAPETETNGTPTELRIATITDTLGANTLNIKRSGAGALFVIGINAYDSTVPAIDVWNMGYSGVKVASWVASSQVWSTLSALEFTEPDLTLINIGINDETAGTDPASFSTDLTTLIAGAKLSGDAILIIPNPVSTANASAAAQTLYRDLMYAVAAAQDIPVIDLSTLFESYVEANALGLMYDVLHPNKLAYASAGPLAAKAILSLG